MPTTNPDIQYVSSPGNTYFSVSVPSTAVNPVVFLGTADGQNVLATVTPGNTGNFYCTNGFWVYSPAGTSSFTYTGSQPYLAAANLLQIAPSAMNSPLTNSTLGVGTVYMRPFRLQCTASLHHINVFASIATTFSNSNATGSAGITLSAALYSRGTGASSDNIYSFLSCSAYWAFSNSSDTALTLSVPVGISNSIAMSTISTGLATSDASKYLATTVGGFRAVPMPFSATLAPGEYYFALQYSKTSANASFNMAMSILQETYSNQIAYAALGVASIASNASVPNFNLGLGAYSATTNAFPSAIPLTASAITGAPVMTTPAFVGWGYTTNASAN